MSPLEIIGSLAQNVALLLALTSAYTFISSRLQTNTRRQSLVQGFLFGIFGILNMLSPIQVASGVLIDARPVVVIISGAKGGFLSAVVTAVLTSLYRINLGGAGVTSGLVAIWLCAFIGWVFHTRQEQFSKQSLLYRLSIYFGLGIVAALASILVMLFLPTPQRENVLNSAALPMLLIFPFASMLTAALIFQQERYFEMVSALADERTLLRTLVDHMPDYIFVKDTKLRFLVSNTAHTKAAHASDSDELLGKMASDYFSPVLTALFEADDRRVLAGEVILAQERSSVNEHGEPIIVSTTKVPVRNSAGSIVGVVGISRDITVEKLRAAQSHQLEAEQQRIKILQTFIQNLSHDFRTPLSLISTSLYMLRRNLDTNQRNERLDRIQEQVDRITSLLDNAAVIVKLDMDAVVFQFEQTNVSPLLRNLADIYRRESTLKDQTLQITVESDPLIAEVDEYLLTIAVKQLLVNAINYTDAGGTVILTAHQDGDRLEIVVEDNGIGIAPEDQPHIFERSYRGDKARSMTTGGSGMGLSIVKKIVEGHQGNIHVESEKGCGTKFTVRLPLTQVGR